MLGPQRLQLYPRLTPGQRLLDYSLQVDPLPAGHYRQLDAEGNEARWLYFTGPTAALTVQVRLRVESPPVNPFDFVIFPFEATRLPFDYPADEAALLAPYRPAPETLPVATRDWTAAVIRDAGGQTLPFLMELAALLRRDFSYVIRQQGAPHPPDETLALRRGSCRDLSMLMVAACQSAGLAARFVSGYAWAGEEAVRHELHAWAEVYLPGAGWRGFDPTQGAAVAEYHVALAASASTDLASPLRGFYWGQTPSTLDTEVSVVWEE